MSDDINIEGMLGEYVDIDQIMEDPMNPNEMDKQQLDALEFSMTTKKNVVPIVLNRVKGKEKPYMVINGHQRLKILKRRKVKRVASIIVEEDIDEARAFGLGLNIHGENNTEKLSNLFLSLHNSNKLDLVTKFNPSFTHDYINLTTDKFHNIGLSNDTEIDDEPLEIPESTDTETGDIYKLGRHLLMCGDSGNPEDVKKLLGDNLIHHVNTDPPYGVDYQGKGSFLHVARPNSKRHQFESEKPGAIEDYREFFGNFLKLIPFHETNTVYIFMAGLRLHELRMAMDDAGITWSDYLVWVKNHFVFGRKDHKAKHEFIVYGWKGKHKFFGDPATSTVYEQDRPQKSVEHPTMKPIELVSRLLLEGSRMNDNVYEPFSGSGTCLLACEQHDRIFFGMEKIPHYVDLAIKRWEKMTGEKAIKL